MLSEDFEELYDTGSLPDSLPDLIPIDTQRRIIIGDLDENNQVNHINHTPPYTFHQVNHANLVDFSRSREYHDIDTNDPGGLPFQYHHHHQLRQLFPTNTITRQQPNYQLLRKPPNYPKYCSQFGWALLNIIQATFDHTTQYARQPNHDNFMKKHYLSRFPAMNVSRRHEAVATDTIYSDTPAVDNGAKIAQIFIGRESFFADVYGMNLTKSSATPMKML